MRVSITDMLAGVNDTSSLSVSTIIYVDVSNSSESFSNPESLESPKKLHIKLYDVYKIKFLLILLIFFFKILSSFILLASCSATLSSLESVLVMSSSLKSL